MGKIYHVSLKGNDRSDGSEAAPFRTIGRATRIAVAGDVVRVHGGTYRECVRPYNGGKNAYCPIVYEAAEGERPRIVGSEEVTGWKKVGGVYEARVDNGMFGEFNPFDTVLAGDWLRRNLPGSDEEIKRVKHLGCVYIGGDALKEATDEAALGEPMRWKAEVGEAETVIRANFGSRDPNAETVEINVRKYCFVPDHCGVNYITVRGFEIAQAATQWAPPTAEQEGALWTYWSKGWVIENNYVHDSKCSGISLGKEISTGQNRWSRFGDIGGYQSQLEVVFNALKAGWSKELVGSHTVRNNEIARCGQAGVVGHLGGAFSEIYRNDIHHVGSAQEFTGDEIGGIKLHAAIDTYIHDNVISHCARGLWLDWQAQGVRVSRNVFFDNGPSCDFFIEITHGPCLVDDNVFASRESIINAAQGTAFVNNLIAGGTRRWDGLSRSTPYHAAHSTDVRGTACVYSYDDRMFNNIFAGKGGDEKLYGTVAYDGCTTSLDEYVSIVRATGRDVDGYAGVRQPAYIGGNLYFDGAKCWEHEKDAFLTENSPGLSVERRGDEITIILDIPKGVKPVRTIGTADLPEPRISNCPYENPDGTPLVCDLGLDGAVRGAAALPGPFGGLKEGKNAITVRVYGTEKRTENNANKSDK